MLVLTRKLNESIIIRDDIEIKIVEIAKDSIKLGISAPKDVPVNRKEIFEAIKKANIEASSPPLKDLSALKKKLSKS